MNRKDLRNSEQEWRRTKQHNLKTKVKKEVKSLKKVLIIAVVLILAGLLWESQKSCESEHGSTSSACVD